MISSHVLIAGAGHAGGRVAQHLRKAGHTGKITLVGDEPYAPYERPALSKEMLMGTKTVEDLTLAPLAFWAEGGSVERIVDTIRSVDAANRTARISGGQNLAFDELVIATGGTPRALSIPGFDLPCVKMLRTLDDCHLLRLDLSAGKRIAIVGGGVIGMEAAASAVALGLQVTVLEAGSRVMARSLPPEASDWLQDLHAANGVDVRTGVAVTSLALADGECRVTATDAAGKAFTFPVDTVLVAVGIVPGISYLERSGIATDNGVLVDGFCRSPGAEWCYAAGDIANTYNGLYQRHVRQETWRNAENQAMAVAEFITGRTEPYVEIPWMWSDQFSRNIQVVGIYTPGDTVIARGEVTRDSGTLLWLHEGRVAGGVLINSGRERKHLEALVSHRASVDAEKLADPAVALKGLV
jgi:3-phenylpropionate/trans-cinnamate dioxygenase ferredoxin reductase subunit